MSLPRRFFGAKGAAKCALGWALGTAVLPLSACGTAVYVDSRREAGQTAPVGMSTPDMVAICYSKSPATSAEALKLAESECAHTGRTPQFHSEERWTCTLAAPRRIFYRCVAKP
jgi:hypothetical protein